MHIDTLSLLNIDNWRPEAMIPIIILELKI